MGRFTIIIMKMDPPRPPSLPPLAALAEHQGRASQAASALWQPLPSPPKKKKEKKKKKKKKKKERMSHANRKFRQSAQHLSKNAGCNRNI